MRRAYLVFATIFFLTPLTQASLGTSPTRLDLMAGVYTLHAKSDSNEGSISHMVYKGTARHSIFPSFEIALSYTLFTGDISAKDIGYGPDVGFNYYPWTNAAPIKIKSNIISLDLHEQMRPFISGSFHQRQFQSLNSSYAGFSLGGGSDFHYSEVFDIRFEGRYMLLQGPNSNQAKQLDLMIGISIGM